MLKTILATLAFTVAVVGSVGCDAECIDCCSDGEPESLVVSGSVGLDRADNPKVLVGFIGSTCQLNPKNEVALVYKTNGNVEVTDDIDLASTPDDPAQPFRDQGVKLSVEGSPIEKTFTFTPSAGGMPAVSVTCRIQDDRPLCDVD